MVRLNRFLAQCGVCSRREADRLIARGEVKVNGSAVRELGVRVNSVADEVQVRGEIVRPVTALTYVMLNKPAGYVTAVKDKSTRPTVMSLVNSPLRLFPIGRLDIDSEGLLLLTNDGSLSYRLTHPRFKVPKIYRVVLDKPVNDQTVKAFGRGIKIDHSRPARGIIKRLPAGDGRVCDVTLFEGRNRQVRKMFAAAGYRVKRLQRTHLGPLALGNLKPGTWRYLSQREIDQLTNVQGLSNGNPK